MAKRALLIHNNKFFDKSFSPLLAPAEDITRLKELLERDYVGFDPKNIIVRENLNLEDFRDQISRFFGKADKDDLLFFYYAGHGIRGKSGELFLALKGTTQENYDAVSMNASYIRGKLESSFSEKKIVMLDCCNAGAFRNDGSFTARASVNDDGLLNAAFDPKGTGTYVLGASQSGASAYETVDETGQPYSLFTNTFIRGIESGEAAPGKDTINLIDISGYIHSQRNKDGKETLPYLDTTNAAGYLEFARNPNTEAVIKVESRAQLDRTKSEAGTLLNQYLLAKILTVSIVAGGLISAYLSYWSVEPPELPDYPTPYFGDRADAESLGMTMFVIEQDSENPNFIGLHCYDAQNSGKKCQVPKGNIRCDQKYPLLCISNSIKLLPDYAKSKSDYWSNGKVIVTDPIYPPRKLSDAKLVCTNATGAEYRLADYSEATSVAGGFYYAVKKGKFNRGPFWVDMEDNPESACWSDRTSPTP